ncbi:MAG TPA: hypothetical protein VFJ58_13490 [Armatimonadota bacterium]|nr:hypothetical protein [Armatimonadota bacterium]
MNRMLSVRRHTGTSGLVILAILTACGLTAGCGGSASSPADGSVTNGVYKNSFFGLSMPIPNGWTIASQETEQHLSALGGRLVAGNNKSMQASMDAAKTGTYHLLNVSEHPIGAPVVYNPSVIVMAESEAAYPGIQTGSDFLFQLKRLLEHSALRWRAVGSSVPETVGGKSFYRLDGTMQVMGMTVWQSYFVTIDRRYALSFIISAGSADQLAQMRKIVHAVTFA